MIPTDQNAVIFLRAGLKARAPLNLLAQKVGRGTAECDRLLWRFLGVDVRPMAAPVIHRRFGHDPNRQAMGRERDLAPPKHDKHLTAVKGGFPVLGGDAS
jgi:hypothetical protein